ncbi:probable adenylate kinase 7, mitochondrial [Malania oleifera]|uniref:probable adenylate kinase 7, mitochondrial n=1 Tax=Malania oleifera TaxID=397392 RepID=UPI0025AE2293|nr:probable adenylate kinase 7, mitochondrial [Malania oleifera]
MAGISRLRGAAPPLTRRLLGVLATRPFGSAAAAQIQYDDDDYYDYEAEELSAPRSASESEMSVPGRGVQWVIIGEPGAKKHVYAERLSKLLDVPHISMGTLLRQELYPRSSLYQQIANAVNHGKLVPEDIIFGLLSKRLEEGYCRGETGFILDGIPRTRIQAEILDQITAVDLVVNFKCTEEHMVEKHLGIGNCSPCREFHSISRPVSNLNLQSQDDQLKSSNADTGRAWNEKFRIYAEQSKLLEDYYRKQKKLLNFQVAGAPGETWQGLLAALHLQHMNAVSLPTS